MGTDRLEIITGWFDEEGFQFETDDVTHLFRVDFWDHQNRVNAHHLFDAEEEEKLLGMLLKRRENKNED